VTFDVELHNSNWTFRQLVEAMRFYNKHAVRFGVEGLERCDSLLVLEI